MRVRRLPEWLEGGRPRLRVFRRLALVTAGTLMVGWLSLPGEAVPASPDPVQGPVSKSVLTKSPLSGGVLMAQAVRAGRVTPASGGSAESPGQGGIAVLPDVQASDVAKTMPVNEDPIAADPRNPVNLMTGGNDFNCSTFQGFYPSITSGTTWGPSYCLPPDPGLPGASGAGDPVVGFDRAGRAYIGGLDVSSSTWEVYLETALSPFTAWASSVTGPVPALFPGGIKDKPWLEIDHSAVYSPGGRAYVSATEFTTSSSTEICVAFHNLPVPGPWIFPAICPDPTVHTFPNVVQFSDLAIEANGDVFVTWIECTAGGTQNDCGGQPATVWMSESENGGVSWTPQLPVTTVTLAPDTCGAFYGCLPNYAERVSEIPAVDAGRGSCADLVDVVTYTWTGTQMRVQVSRSVNEGTSWLGPVRVAPPTWKRDQFFPWLSYSPKGRLGVSWLDRQLDPTNHLYRTRASLSKDCGKSFATPLLVSSFVPGSDPANDGFGGSFLGDYTGNIWDRDGRCLHVSWMDTRNGTNSQDWAGGVTVIGSTC